MHPQALQILSEIEGDLSGFRSISGISSTTNIDSGSDKYSCIVSNSGTLSLREFHERYWSPDFKICRSFRGCHFNCRSHELLWTHGRSCIHLIGDHLLAMKDIFEVLLVKI
uniref:Uncharacterized protein n=1 Tax=Oryza barthii TaxID=65489 RepID=A0A0D3F4J3_9ORYZ